MSSRRERIAIRDHVDDVQRVVSAVVHGRVTFRAISEATSSSDQFSFVLNRGERVRVRSGVLMDIMVVQQVRMSSERVEIVGYIYAIWLHSGEEIAAYHWHPQNPRNVPFPHFHAGPAIVRLGGAVRPRDVHTVHFPTGLVSLASVIRLAIAELGVEPLRPDWDTILI